MDENKRLTEQIEFVPADTKQDNKVSWGQKSVTRRFLIIALAAAVLLNAALTAGIAAGMLKKQAKNMPDMPGKGRPGSEMHFDKDRNGNDSSSGDSDNSKGRGGNGNDEMTPPGGGTGGGSDSGSGQQQSSKASIGIVIREDSGVYVAQVTGDNAKKAGFKEGDKIVSVDGKDISSGNDLISVVQSHSTGDTITVTVERDGQQVELKTELE